MKEFSILCKNNKIQSWILLNYEENTSIIKSIKKRKEMCDQLKGEEKILLFCMHNKTHII